MPKASKTTPALAPEMQERREALERKTDSFCEAHLNAEYKKLCRKLIAAMSKVEPPPFGRGGEDIWAAGIVHALGAHNFLFDKSTKPYVSAAQIADFFGVKPGSAAQRAAMIRDTMGLDFFDFGSQFLTTQTRRHQSEMQRIMVDTIAALHPDVPREVIIAEMPRLGAPSRGTARDEFVDRDREVMSDFYEVAQLVGQAKAPKLEAALRNLIAEDPDFLDSYAMLADLLIDQGREAEAKELREEAYNRAVALISDRQGQWPLAVRWGWLENRHILRALMERGRALWEAGFTQEALELNRKLLRLNPDDNQGLRYVILAQREGRTYDGWDADFLTPEGFWKGEPLLKWFDEGSRRFPDEFDWWKKAVGYEEDE